MSTTVDSGTIRTLRPGDLSSYLLQHGWQLAERLAERAEVWQQGGAELLLPLDPGLADYGLRMAEVLSTLARWEERSREAVLHDLQNAGWDLIRFALDSNGLADGSIGLEVGVNLFQRARDLLQAAAVTAARPQTVQTGRRPREVADFLGRVRLGQTEAGSYVVQLRAPVPPPVQPEQLLLYPERQEAPFERRATATLAGLLASASELTERWPDAAHSDWLARSRREGLSANLCEALLGVFEPCPEGRLTTRFTWSIHRPPPPAPGRIAFQGGRVEPLRELARTLRASEPRSDFELAGPVVQLERGESAAVGRTIVLGLVDGRPRRVELELDEEDYPLAVEAHRTRGWLSCEGELQPGPRTWRLRHPRHLALLPGEGSIEE